MMKNIFTLTLIFMLPLYSQCSIANSSSENEFKAAAQTIVEYISRGDMLALWKTIEIKKLETKILKDLPLNESDKKWIQEDFNRYIRNDIQKEMDRKPLKRTFAKLLRVRGDRAFTSALVRLESGDLGERCKLHWVWKTLLS